MLKHIKIYCDYFKIGPQDSPMCEWCERRVATDVHHIDCRGAGGSKTKDYIENLAGLCRPCHLLAEAKKISKEELKAKHLKKLNNG